MATSKTVSSVSESNKSNTNSNDTSYLVFGTSEGLLDNESYEIYSGKTKIEDIVDSIQSTWDGYPIKDLRVLKFKTSDLKSIKQTLELV
jgi:hypothetical protein